MDAFRAALDAYYAAVDAYCKEMETKPVPHPSEVVKPALSMNDLHLIGRALDVADDCEFGRHENRRLDELFDVLSAYLSQTIGEDWMKKEALV